MYTCARTKRTRMHAQHTHTHVLPPPADALLPPLTNKSAMLVTWQVSDGLRVLCTLRERCARAHSNDGDASTRARTLSHCTPSCTRAHTVKQRIRAIKNIGKITKAMKMVAASKMKNAQIAVENSRGSVDPFIRLFGDHPGVCVSVYVLLLLSLSD